MQSLKYGLIAAIVVGAGLAAACSDASSSTGGNQTGGNHTCGGVSFSEPPTSSTAMNVVGIGLDTMRYSAEIAVRGTLAYTSSWEVRYLQGDKIDIWDVSGACPALIDSVIVTGVVNTGDVQISDDGTLLMVATEFEPGSVAIYSLADPKHPALLSRYSSDQTLAGVHTAKFGRVNGKLYGFLCIDPTTDFPARLVILDLSNPSSPAQVYVKITGNPYVHDTFPRDGYLFVTLWNDGLDIWDIGGGGTGATPANPRVLGNVRTIGGEVHNVWWYHDASGSKQFAFVGEESAGTVGSTSRGDIHVIDVSDFTQPKEVAFYHVDGAGTHNFSVDETNGVLYAAYYNGGVRALDVHGQLGTCDPSQQAYDQPTNLYRCDLRLTGHEIGIGLSGVGRSVYVWGVQYLPGQVYASDMLNGIWKLSAVR
ncbi:MAG TPA: hypothetical protein VHV78_07730 [Gemmatimonadaceae bacterium]|jgi:hypothetical protein|nr:hypothetical protein [Gemmatimonadaceae bacterium]